MINKNKTLIYAVIFGIILLGIDQTTKIIIHNNNYNMTIISNILEIHKTQNKGGAFGIGQGNIAMFIITNLIILGLIIRFIYFQKDFIDKITLYSLFSILAGGFGNLIDRIVYGYVIDFIKIFPSIHFPIFNFADICITIGWIVFAFVFAMYSSKEIKNIKRIKE